MKQSFLKYFWKNSIEFIVFCFVVAPAFVFGATLISGWSNSFYYALGFVGLLFIGSVIGSYFRWKRL